MTLISWKTKATIQRTCASIPFGGDIYGLIQRTFGNLRRPDPSKRLRAHASMMGHLMKHGFFPVDSRIVEVGTGWIPTIPIGFWLCGAEVVYTYDLHSYFDHKLLNKALDWISRNRQLVESWYGDIVDQTPFKGRLAHLISLKGRGYELLSEARIIYIAPGDARHTGLPEGTIDCHFSHTVLEHIPCDVIKDILVESCQILRDNGCAIHVIDTSDHYSHADPTISSINFLQYSDREWEDIAGNRFAYHNRLRSSDFLRMFAESGLRIVHQEVTVNPRSLEVLQDGLTIDERFAHCDAEELCGESVVVVATKPEQSRRRTPFRRDPLVL